MSVHKKWLIVSLAALGVSSLVQAHSQQSGAPLLKGSVELSGNLPPIDSRITTGNKFDSKLLKKTPGGSWVKIPAWLAGTWRQDIRTRTYRRDEISGEEARRPETFVSARVVRKGYQNDAAGQVFDYLPTGVIEEVRGDGSVTYSLLTENEPVTISEDKVVIARKTVDVCVDLATSAIVDSYQVEEFETFRPAGGNAVRVDLSMRTFSAGGRAKATLELFSPMDRIAGFQAVDKYQGQDLKKAFAAYQKSIK